MQSKKNARNACITNSKSRVQKRKLHFLRRLFLKSLLKKDMRIVFRFVEEKRFQITVVCREWGVVQVFYRFRRPEEGYIRLNGPGEFFQKQTAK